MSLWSLVAALGVVLLGTAAILWWTAGIEDMFDVWEEDE